MNSIAKAFSFVTLEAVLFSACVSPMKKLSPLPDYVVINNENQAQSLRTVLIHPCKSVSFPLSAEDQTIIQTLEKKFDQETNCAGLAAPQIGFDKRIIVFSAPNDPQLKKWRKDFTQYMPKTIWINPEYEAIGTECSEDYEGCFSVNDLAGIVKRFNTVRYKAYLPDGTEVQGSATGFLARIIQHEVDHVNGKLFLDCAEKNSLFSISEYRNKRQHAIEEKDAKDTTKK